MLNSDLINLAHRRKYVKGDGGPQIMNDGSEVDVSRHRKDDVLSQISLSLSESGLLTF